MAGGIILNAGSRKSRGAAATIAATLASALRSLAWGGKHFWLTVAMVVVGAILHYICPLSLYSAASPLQFTSQNMHRILFMVPVAYAGFIFGPTGGFTTLAVVTLVMIPKAFFMSTDLSHDVVETLSTVMVSFLIILWFGGQQKEKRRRFEILSRLELARQELAFQVDVIKKNERRVAALHEVCCAVTQSLDPSVLLQKILDKVVEEMGVAVALIFLKGRDTRRLELVAYTGVSEEFAKSVAYIAVGEGFNGRVVESGEPMVVEDASHDPRLAFQAVVKEGLQAFLIVPLRAKGETIGTLCAATRTSRSFSLDDKELLTAIGSQVGIAIENARLYEEALTSEQKYRDLFENATVSILVQNLDGTITAGNNACANLTGYPLNVLAGMTTRRLFPHLAHSTLAAMQQSLLRGEAEDQPYDLQMVRRDGSESILSVTTRLVSEHGEPRGFQHIAIDVTERRRMRDTLNYYVRQVLTAQEEERKRIARELHDDTAQSLFLLLQKIEGMTYGTSKRRSNSAMKELEELRSVALQTLGNVRRLTRDLRPQILDDLGLVAALEWLAEDMERQSGIKTTVEVLGTQRPLTPEAQLLLFRITQEALSNVRRHSAASAASAVLEFVDGKVKVSVEDNGRGFSVPASLSDLAGKGKLGILGMSERARLLGGGIAIYAEPGSGTRVTAELVA